MKQDRDKVIALLKADVNALEGFVNSIKESVWDRSNLISSDELALNLLESDMKADVCKDCLVKEDKKK